MEHQERIWFVDPATLQEVVVDRDAMEARLEGCTDLERVWVLSLLGRGEEAVSEARKVLAASTDPFSGLLVLAYAYQRLYRWGDVSRLLQAQALRLARTKFSEAQVRHQIGRRLLMKVFTLTRRQSSTGLPACSGLPVVHGRLPAPAAHGTAHEGLTGKAGSKPRLGRRKRRWAGQEPARCRISL